MSAITQVKVIEEAAKLGIKIRLAGQSGVYLEKGSNVRLRKMRDDLEREGIDFYRWQLGAPSVDGYGNAIEMGVEPEWPVPKEAPTPKEGKAPKQPKVVNQTAFTDGKAAKSGSRKKVQAGPSLFDFQEPAGGDEVSAPEAAGQAMAEA